MRRGLTTPSLALLCLLVAGRVSLLPAVERLVHRIEPQEGLPDGVVLALAQDADGFVWIGTRSGLARYDGAQIRHRAAAELPRVDMIAASRSGEVVAGWTDRTPWIVSPGEPRALPGPRGAPLEQARTPVFLDDGALWIIDGGRVLRRDPSGTWDVLDPGAIGDERPRLLSAGSGNAVLVVTSDGVWRAGGLHAGEKILELPGIVAVVPLDDGAIAAAEFCCRVIEARDGEVIERLRFTGRAIDLERRGETIWLVYDHGLVGLHAGRRPETIPLPSATELMLDREGTLWVGTRNGIRRYPEPEAFLITIADGLPKDVRYLARTEGATWVSATGGLGRIQTLPEGGISAASALEIITAFPLCVDASGRLWGGGGRGDAYTFVVFERTGGRFAIHDFGELGTRARSFACAPDPEGRVTIALGGRLFRTPASGGRPVPMASLEDLGVEPLKIIEDSRGTLIVADHFTLCRAPADQVRSGPASWTCLPIGSGGEIYDLVEAAPGEIWVGTTDSGVLRLTDRGFEPALEGTGQRATWITGLAPSPRGGVWVMASGQVHRLGREGGAWKEIEHLSAWNGAPIQHGIDVHEDDDGAIWMTTAEGVLRVPASARGGAPAPPPVRLVDLSIPGAEAPAGAGLLELPASHGAIEVRFAALSYREPGLIRYRVRESAAAPWSLSTSGSFRYPGLAPGSYTIEAQATLDGVRWSETARAPSLRVLPPWYRTGWAILLLIVLLAAAAYGTHRAVLAHRVRLERQRVSIAMDLHDEMGSGLGTIGILAGIASREGTDPGLRLGLSRQIAQVSAEIGDALSDIVWSLRPGAETLESLVHHLAERGGRLFAGENPIFQTETPAELPRVRLPLPVRRNLQRIITEAMHNAARHAHARNVTLRLQPAGSAWRLSVCDDGKGMEVPPDRGAGSGLGLASMRARAREMGATIEWTRTPGGGTTVSVLFGLS